MAETRRVYLFIIIFLFEFTSLHVRRNIRVQCHCAVDNSGIDLNETSCTTSVLSKKRFYICVVTDSCARFGPCLYDGYMEGTTLILWIRPVQSSIFFRSYWRRSSDLETIWFLLRTRRIKNLKSKSKCRIINADNYIFFPPLKNLRWWILQLLFSIRCVTRYPASKKKKN